MGVMKRRREEQEWGVVRPHYILLTRDRLNLLKSVTKEQLALLGLEWPPQRGWKDRLEGQRITPERWKAVLEATKANRPKGLPGKYKAPGQASLF